MAPRMQWNPKTGRMENVSADKNNSDLVQDALKTKRTPTMPKGTTTTTVPKGATPAGPRGSYQVPKKTKAQIESEEVRGTALDPDSPAGLDLNEFLNQYIEQGGNVFDLYNMLSGSGGGGGGTGAASKRQASQAIARAGRQAKAEYNRLAEELFNRSMSEADTYYGGREATARKQIDDATQQFLSSLVTPTAYQNMPLPQMQVQEQGLGESLGAYGATGDLARQQRASSQGELDFARDLASRSAQQLNDAQRAYMDSIRNAGLGAQAAAQTGLTQNMESMRGQTRADAEAVRRQLLLQAIEAGMAGRTNAAQALL